MKECDNCAYGGWLNGKDAITEICTKCRYICGEPTKWKAMPMTNADRIRAMSDEELKDSVIAVHHGYAPWCDYHCENKGDDGCDRCIEKWLKQPADMRGEEDAKRTDL